MPVVNNKVLIKGTISTTEVWSIGLTFIGPTAEPLTLVDNQTDLDDWATQIVADLDFSTSPAIINGFSTTTKITEVVTQYRAGSNLVLQSVAAPASFTGGGTDGNPFPTSICVSLLTGVPGARYRGRVYLPFTGGVVGTDGKVSGADAYSLDFIDMISQIIGATATPAALRLAVYSPTYDVLTPVKQVRVGDVPDTQRRRRDNLVETYSTNDL